MDIFRLSANLSAMVRDGFTYKNIICRHGKIGRWKGWEVQIAYTTFRQLFYFAVSWTTKEDHAGFRIEFTLFGLFAEFQIYDGRHWNYKLDRWEKQYKPR